ncbi:MAG: PqqD family protein [Acidimicrobiia bacterium]|nr:PqqD family protein [Acidimicrobiia bacterium]
MTAEQVHPDSIDSSFVPQRGSALASIEIDNEGLLFDEDSGTWHFLNPMAQVIWSCCDGTGSVEEISRDISEIFGEEYDTVLSGVLDTVRRFGEQGLLGGVEQTATAGHSHDHDHDHDDDHDHDHGEAADANKPRFLPVPPSS